MICIHFDEFVILKVMQWYNSLFRWTERECLVNSLVVKNLIWHWGRHFVTLQRPFFKKQLPVILPVCLSLASFSAISFFVFYLFIFFFILCILNSTENRTIQFSICQYVKPGHILHLCRYSHSPLCYKISNSFKSPIYWCFKTQVRDIFSKRLLLTRSFG